MANYIVVDPGYGKKGSLTDIGIYIGKINSMFKIQNSYMNGKSLANFIINLQKVLKFQLIMDTSGPGNGLMYLLKKNKVKFRKWEKWNVVIDHNPDMSELLKRLRG